MVGCAVSYSTESTGLPVKMALDWFTSVDKSEFLWQVWTKHSVTLDALAAVRMDRASKFITTPRCFRAELLGFCSPLWGRDTTLSWRNTQLAFPGLMALVPLVPPLFSGKEKLRGGTKSQVSRDGPEALITAFVFSAVPQEGRVGIWYMVFCRGICLYWQFNML